MPDAGRERWWKWVPRLLPFAVAFYWYFAERAAGKFPNYSHVLAKVFLDAPFWSLLGPLRIPDKPDYIVFFPLGINLMGTIDRFVIAPLMLGPLAHDVDHFAASASRLSWLAIAWLGVIAAVTFWFLRRVTGSQAAALVGAAYLGLNHGFSQNLYFTNSFGVYPMLLGAIITVDALIEITRADIHPTRGQLVRVGGGLLIETLSYEQSGDLPVALLITFIVLLWYTRGAARRFTMAGLVFPVAAFALFVSMQLPNAVTLTSQVSEDQYVFSYPSVLLMLEDMVLNTSFHLAYGLDSLLIPWPLMSVSVMSRLNMNLYNVDNTFNAQLPNIAYRTLGLWYAGLLFAVAIWFSAKLIILLVRERGESRNIPALFGLVLYWCGFPLHVPIMFRDYFLIPGHDIGYKAHISHLGLAILLGWAAAKWVVPWLEKFAPWRQMLILGAFCAWVVLCNYSKLALNSADIFNFKYPW